MTTIRASFGQYTAASDGMVSIFQVAAMLGEHVLAQVTADLVWRASRANGGRAGTDGCFIVHELPAQDWRWATDKVAERGHVTMLWPACYVWADGSETAGGYTLRIERRAGENVRVEVGMHT